MKKKQKKKQKKSPINISVISEIITGDKYRIRHTSRKFAATILEAENTVVGIFEKSELNEDQERQKKAMKI